ncbi:hypothetical protein AL485_02590 [Serratia liquefaciens]|nr:hypothetical protein AL485_02590 [Serratia liquefaciens]
MVILYEVVMINFLEKHWVSVLLVGSVVWTALLYVVEAISFYKLIGTAILVVFPLHVLILVVVLYTKKIKP